LHPVIGGPGNEVTQPSGWRKKQQHQEDAKAASSHYPT
jgi:hypothetical protein